MICMVKSSTGKSATIFVIRRRSFTFSKGWRNYPKIKWHEQLVVGFGMRILLEIYIIIRVMLFQPGNCSISMWKRAHSRRNPTGLCTSSHSLGRPTEFCALFRRKDQNQKVGSKDSLKISLVLVIRFLPLSSLLKLKPPNPESIQTCCYLRMDPSRERGYAEILLNVMGLKPLKCHLNVQW